MNLTSNTVLNEVFALQLHRSCIAKKIVTFRLNVIAEFFDLFKRIMCQQILVINALVNVLDNVLVEVRIVVTTEGIFADFKMFRRAATCE